MKSSIRERALFPLFFASGFCGLLYQVVWTRLAFTSFGVITPVLSIVVSVFMLGLALGSWGASKWIDAWAHRTGIRAITFYALIEIGIGIGAFAVPKLFDVGEQLLFTAGEMNSVNYLVRSGVILALVLLPWCVLMGATTPVAMAFLKEDRSGSATTFSFLYFANVIGAFAGVLISALALIELFGFHGTLKIGGFTNFAIGALAIVIGMIFRPKCQSDQSIMPTSEEETADVVEPRATAETVVLLFMTGFCSMGLEVIWTRTFTPVLWTTVYSFAELLATYLLATWIGSFIYRRWRFSVAQICLFLAGAAMFSILLCDPRVQMNHVATLFSIFPLCAGLGYLTPKLIDEASGGRPDRAGKLYAINTIGCILGPLVASYLLLPTVGITWGLRILSLPFLIFAAKSLAHPSVGRVFAGVCAAFIVMIGLPAFLITRSFEDFTVPNSITNRDYAATVVSKEANYGKVLEVNGIGLTILTPITKIMTHMPLARLERKPNSILVLCFGMGTTFRSGVSWGIPTTAVELVPSVPKALRYYHADAAEVMSKPNGRVIIDDARRFLRRTNEKFDVITIDPPPPVSGAGASLLYSEEFYRLLKERLTEDGILQHWIPGAAPEVNAAIVRSLCREFPFVEARTSVEGWGIHLAASRKPIPSIDAAKWIERMPPNAQKDMVEWVQDHDLKKFIESILDPKLILPVEGIYSQYPNSIAITDDRPFNEYFALRSFKSWREGKRQETSNNEIYRAQ